MQFTLRLHIPGSYERWSNTFSKDAIEKMTRRLENYKSFSTFLNMTTKAFDRSCESVTFEIHTREQVEEIRSKKTQALKPNSQQNRG